MRGDDTHGGALFSCFDQDEILIRISYLPAAYRRLAHFRLEVFWKKMLSSGTYLPVLCVLLSANVVHGWGADGHSLLASIAQSVLSNESLDFVRAHLPWYTSGNISMLASWPDFILYPDTNPVDYLNWQWSKQLHFVDTKDWACEYNREQDCDWTGEQRCVDGTIQNYTRRLADGQQDDVQRQEALKFLVHFIGDAHQPLHAGFKGDRGGNSIRGEKVFRR